MANFKLDRFKYTWRGQWSTATDYIRDDVVSYGGSSFVCISAHTADTLFSTDLNNQDQTNNVPAPRWVKMTDGYAWRDSWESGSTYDPGDVVQYGGNLYLCVISHISEDLDQQIENWTLYSEQVSFRAAWDESTKYDVNDVIVYGGIVYRCIESHTSSTAADGVEADQEKWSIYFVGEEYRGDWAVGQRYRVNDLVKFGSSVYRCKKAHSPSDDSTINFDQDEFWETKFPGYQYRGEWDSLTTYRTGDVVRHGGWLFYSLADNFDDIPSSNIYQLDNRTDPVSWQIVTKGINFRGEWNQENSYKTGDLVRRGGNIYIALLDTEVTNDGSSLDYLDESNWELVSQGQSFTAAWQQEVEYAVGDVVTFAGSAYLCILSHISDSTSFPSEDTASAGLGFVYWTLLVAAGQEAGMIYRGDLLTYNLKREFYGDDSSFGATNLEISSQGKLITVDDDNTVMYKSYGLVNRVFYVATNGVDDIEDPERGISPYKPWKTVRFACEQADDGFQGTTTVRVKTGRYSEILPIIVPVRTAVVGDELRSTTITASGPIENLALDSSYTIAALSRISQIMQVIIANTETTVSVKTGTNPLDPVIFTETVITSVPGDDFISTEVEIQVPVSTSEAAAESIQNLIAQIIQYIEFYVDNTGTAPIVSGTNQKTSDELYLNSVDVLIANKEFFAEEAVAFIQEFFPDYNFEADLCKRDVRRYIDAIAYDTQYPGNYKSLLAARYYRNAILGSQLEDMFYLRDSTGLRNCTVSGLSGELDPEAIAAIFRLPTGGAYCSLDPGWGPADNRTWINTRSPYIQNVTTLGRGAIGQKIDGAIHAGGNKSMVSNDFTQVIDDGIGAWVLNNGRAELVSVFSYYAHVGYLATNGGIIRSTNGNNSYGRFGCLADGNDDTEVPQTGLVNTRNQQAFATVFAGDFTDEIQVVEWNNAGQQYSQAAATFVGAGANASVVFEDFRDNAVQNVNILDTSDSIIQIIGGGGYLRIQNNAQPQDNAQDNLTSIKIAANDPNIQDDYLGCRITITGGPGTGQYAYITAYNIESKVVQVSRESDNQPGWDHVVPGTPVETNISASTAYRIEPRPIFDDPGFDNDSYTASLSTDWGSLVYGETSDLFENIEGELGTGTVVEQDGLVPVAATFNITKTGRVYAVTVSNPGAGYVIGDTITILGDELGGNSPINDIEITVIATTDDSTNAISDISFTGIAASGKFIAITKTGTAGVASPDGENWEESFNMPSSGDWTVSASGNNRFIAIKDSTNEAAYSLNGIDWITTSMPDTSVWSSAVYGNNKFVVIARDQNNAAYSADGESWTAATMPTVGDSTFNEWVDITYGKGKFVAIANSQNIAAYSEDGISWTGVVMSSDDPRDWVSVAYGNNRYVAIAATGEALYSFDAVTWRTSAMPEDTVIWSKIRYGQGVFFALASSQDGEPTSIAATSPDGIVWTVRTMSSTRWNSIAFGNPYIEFFDSSIGQNTPVWVAISNNNIVNRIKTGARALGRVDVIAGRISSVKLWDPGSGYDNEPNLTIVSPTATSMAAFSCRTADGVLASPSWLNRGIGYRTGTTIVTITGNGSADVTPVGRFVTFKNLSSIPGPGAQIFFAGNPTRYTIATITPLNDGETSARIRLFPELKIRDNLQNDTPIVIRERYSQIRASGHDFLDIGTGNFQETNYPRLYAGLFFSAPEDEVRQENGGKVFYTSTDQSGNFNTGDLFGVEQATGIVTISADFFDLSGLTELRLGGIRLGGSGAVIREFSTDPTFTEDSNNVVPTQRAIRAFLQNRLSLGGSEVATFAIQAGQIFLGAPDVISNVANRKIIVPVRADFIGDQSGLSGSILAQKMFYRSFNN